MGAGPRETSAAQAQGEERLRVLSEAMHAFAEATSDTNEVLKVVARRVAEVVTDACAVLVVSADGDTLEPVAFHSEPSAFDRIKALLSRPVPMVEDSLSKRALESGEPVLLPKLPRGTISAGYRAVEDDIGVHSFLLVPLRVNARSIGILVLGRHLPGSPPYDEGDLDLARSLAHHAALAIATAQAHEKRRDAERAHKLLEGVLEAAPDAMVIIGEDGVIRLVNDAAERLFAYPRGELLGMSIDSLVPERFQAVHPLHRESYFRAPKARPIGVGIDLFARRKDRSEVEVEISLAPLKTSEGTLAIAAIRDVSPRRRVEEALVVAKEAAELANRELEAFSYSVAHDLRAPLRAINGFAQILRSGNAERLDADGKECLDEIVAGTMKMAALIDALLALSRVSRAELRREPVDLSELVRTTIARLAATEARAEVELVLEEPCLAELDAQLARIMIDNLAGNAWKFTARTAAPKIEVGSSLENGVRVYFIRDNGAGFDMAYADKLFVPFQRLHRASEFPGTGIGLATVQRIIHRHGGVLWATGRVSAGATFFFTLRPLRGDRSASLAPPGASPT